MKAIKVGPKAKNALHKSMRSKIMGGIKGIKRPGLVKGQAKKSKGAGSLG